MDIDYPIQNNIFNLMRAIVEVAVLLFFLFFYREIREITRDDGGCERQGRSECSF